MPHGRHVDLLKASLALKQLKQSVEEQHSLLEKGLNIGKDVGILIHSSMCARKMMGARMTSCKSAKDRTSMFQTYEVSRVMQDEQSLAAAEVIDMANKLREEGCRLDNCQLNTGKRKFAFNSMQRPHLPEELCPPAGTCGDVDS